MLIMNTYKQDKTGEEIFVGDAVYYHKKGEEDKDIVSIGTVIARKSPEGTKFILGGKYLDNFHSTGLLIANKHGFI